MCPLSLCLAFYPQDVISVQFSKAFGVFIRRHTIKFIHFLLPPLCFLSPTWRKDNERTQREGDCNLEEDTPPDTSFFGASCSWSSSFQNHEKNTFLLSYPNCGISTLCRKITFLKTNQSDSLMPISLP